MKYYLTADTKEELLADLEQAGFEWPNGEPRKMEVAYKAGFGSCIYLEHLIETPAVIEDGEIVTPAVMTTTFHANVLTRVPHEFATAMQPTTPQHDWA